MPKSVDLSIALPELILAEGRLRAYANANGTDYQFADWGGVRTQADTATILQYRANDYAAARARGDSEALSLSIDDWRPIAPFGSSYHNFGAAFDIDITRFDGSPTPDDALQDLKNAAPMFGLRSAVPHDPGHFELAMPLDAVKQMWLALNGGSMEPAKLSPFGIGVGAMVVLAVALAAFLFLRPKRK